MPARLEIVSPRAGAVQSQNIINGIIQPPGPVQVFVLYPDKKWHLQGDTESSGEYWSATCQFGPENASYGGYDIVAIAGDAIDHPIVDAIPDGLSRSPVVHVQRFPARSSGARPGLPRKWNRGAR